MCTRFVSPETAAIEREWRVGRHNQWKARTESIDVFPGHEAPFIRVSKDSAEPKRELVIGQWNLIPSFAKEAKLKCATCNAQSEELLDKASYKLPWLRGRRCSFLRRCSLSRIVGVRQAHPLGLRPHGRDGMGPSRHVEHLDEQGHRRDS